MNLHEWCVKNNRQDILDQWNYDKNNDLTPKNVTIGTNQKVWWHLPYNDSKTGKYFDFEWEATIANRVKGNGCPYLSGRAVWAGFNDLATTLDVVRGLNVKKFGTIKYIDEGQEFADSRFDFNPATNQNIIALDNGCYRSYVHSFQIANSINDPLINLLIKADN